MKTSSSKPSPSGYISFLLVLATGAILTALMFAAYRRALGAQNVEAQVQLRMDYGEKEEAILRSIVALTPNRAMRAMGNNSAAAGVRDSLSWQAIFTESLAFANSGRSISPAMMSSLNITELRQANTGDNLNNPNNLNVPTGIFSAIQSDPNNPALPVLISAGINRSLLGNYPPPLTLVDPNPLVNQSEVNDTTFPFISRFKQYGALAQPDLNSATLNGSAGVAYGLPFGDRNYAQFNRLRYPDINFGYATPGQPFVAKRNWWAFSMDVSNHDRGGSHLARPRRNFVLSIYEIPSQLSISAASYMALGAFNGGAAWLNAYNIDGGVSVGRADLTGNRALDSLALRRRMTMTAGSSIGGVNDLDPFAPGTREQVRVSRDRLAPVALANQSTLGAFFPVSLASESGRAAFIPISRDRAFFDRFSLNENDSVEGAGVGAGALNHVGVNCLSSTSWNNYSIGAQQCAMRLDITAVTSPVNPTPTALRFQYYLPNGSRAEDQLLVEGRPRANLPVGYERVAAENGVFNLPPNSTADFAFGSPGGFSFRLGLSGEVTFNVNNFGDVMPGTVRAGYMRRSVDGTPIQQPFRSGVTVNGQSCIEVYPERIPAYLALIHAAGPETNSSLVVNVDYSPGVLGNAYRPAIPCHPTNPADPLTDYGVILKECENLTGFPLGFSLVTNLRLFVGDNLNTVAYAPPAGFVPAITLSNPTGLFYPPCSFFAPEKRWGSTKIPSTIGISGQIGSLAKVDKINTGDSDVPIIHPLDSIAVGGNAIAAGNIAVNLRKIRHPAELPPITMMNWLVLLEEVR